MRDKAGSQGQQLLYRQDRATWREWRPRSCGTRLIQLEDKWEASIAVGHSCTMYMLKLLVSATSKLAIISRTNTGNKACLYLHKCLVFLTIIYNPEPAGPSDTSSAWSSTQ